MIERQGLTLVGISVANLEGDGEAEQLTLPVDLPGGLVLDTVLDEVRDRFGTDAVKRAVLVGSPRRLATWLFPEDEEGEGR